MNYECLSKGDLYCDSGNVTQITQIFVNLLKNIYIYNIYIYTYIYICIYTYIYMYIYTYICTHTYIYIWNYIISSSIVLQPNNARSRKTDQYI